MSEPGAESVPGVVGGDGHLAETLAAEDAAGARAATFTTTRARSTVLPRKEGGEGGRLPPADRFKQVKALGRGGLGEVLLALDEDIQRRVAIKRLRDDAMTPAMLMRFAEEVRIIGQLEHPGIVPVHDVGIDDDGKHYLVMKYVEGETLEQVIHRLKAGDPDAVARYGFPERLEIVMKILEALEYAHERGFIHRDIKPANIMVGPHGEVTLMDWGIAKKVGTAEEVSELATTDAHQDRLVETQAGTLLGTPLYMSPEQAAGKNAELDPRTDLFALGLVIVELFTQHHPLEGLESATAVIATLLHKDLGTEEAIFPCFIQAGAPMDVFWFALPALSLDPAARYPSATVMLAELRKVRAGRFRVACHVTASKRLLLESAHWIDRHPRLFTGMLATTVLLTLAGIGFGIFRAVTG